MWVVGHVDHGSSVTLVIWVIGHVGHGSDGSQNAAGSGLLRRTNDRRLLSVPCTFHALLPFSWQKSGITRQTYLFFAGLKHFLERLFFVVAEAAIVGDNLLDL